LAAHGITLLPEDSSSLDPTGLVSDPSRTFALTEAGKLALGISHKKLSTVTTSTASNSAINRKPTITRIVRLNTSGMSGTGLKTQTLKLAPSGQATSNAPKIIKVTPEQFAALKAGR
jgi:hypothetical protein